MKGILEFNLPEEQDDFNGAIKAKDIEIVLFELSEFLMRKSKYSVNTGRTYDEALDEIREELVNLCDERGIKL